MRFPKVLEAEREQRGGLTTCAGGAGVLLHILQKHKRLPTWTHHGVFLCTVWSLFSLLSLCTAPHRWNDGATKCVCNACVISSVLAGKAHHLSMKLEEGRAKGHLQVPAIAGQVTTHSTAHGVIIVGAGGLAISVHELEAVCVDASREVQNVE